MTAALNTLFVTVDGAWVHKDHETVVVEVNGERKVQVPMLHLASVVCLARASVSPDLMAALAEAGKSVAFLSPNGRFLARVEGLPGGGVHLRRAQYRASEEPTRALAIARGLVLGKIANARQVLLHARRDAAEDRREPLAGAAARLARHATDAAAAASLDELRGLEGIAAREYFEAFELLVKRHEDAFRFERRSRRPPLNRMNALLSFGYVLLLQDCAAAAAAVGLDPAVGFLHEDRPGRLSLGLDLMEELRAPVVDRLALALVNRGQLGPDDFEEGPSGAWKLRDGPRKKVLVAYQEAKQAEVSHPLLATTVPWGRVPHLQARLLAQAVRGDLDAYPPFTIH